MYKSHELLPNVRTSSAFKIVLHTNWYDHTHHAKYTIINTQQVQDAVF